MAWCDNIGELLAVICRPGNAGSNTAADHIAIIDAAIAAIPARWRRNRLISFDGAGSSHAVVELQRKLNARRGWSVAYSFGFDLDERAGARLGRCAAGWEAALDPAGLAREDAQVAELTGLLREGADGDRLAGRPADMRILVRREKIEHATQFVTVRADQRLPLPAQSLRATPKCAYKLRKSGPRPRRVEGFIGCGKDTGLARWSSHSFAINTAWVTAVARAIDLLSWMRLLLSDGPLAKAEPATLRYRLLHAAARLVKHARYLILRVPETWPWAQEFAAAVNRVRAFP